nr:helix-hairpin-helix domain-containing protein [Chryseobacterium sp.]
MMKKSYYQKMAFLGAILLTLLAFQKYTNKSFEKFPELTFISENSSSISLSEFNPNELSAADWQKMGFSEKQTATILKYKEIVGGEFTSKEQLKKCYSISPEKYSEIENFILLPEKTQSNHFTKGSFTKKDLKINGKFNPDHYSQNDWEKMGFSEKQASAILKYKSYLGGSFVSKEKFKDCFIISDENYQKLEPYLILPAKTPDNFAKNRFKKDTVREKINYKPFDPNTLDKEGWEKLGFSEKQANVIVNYRDRNLKGSFKSLDDIKNCFVINEEKFNEMKPYIRLSQVKNDSKLDSFKETDFSKTDLNSITFKQLIEFGFDEKAAGSMVGFRKKLGGFVTKEQILDTYNIDKDLTQKLVNLAPLDVSKVQKYSLVDAPEDWLKNHPYFKYSADKIIYYRMSNPDDKKIWKFIKVKPEYEARMRLYVK